MATKINIKDWPKYLERLGDRAKQAMQRGIVAGVNRCVPVLQQRTDHAPPASPRGASGAVNTGEYRRKWRVRVLSFGATIYNPLAYAGVIDRGRRRRKRMPPRRAIEQWAMRRLGLSGKEARQAAYPIARAIGRRGLRPRRVMSGATRQLAAIVTQEARRALAEELRR